MSGLDSNGKKTITIAGKDYQLDFGEDALAKYGSVNIKKECISPKVISVDDDLYLEYKLTVTAGDDGCSDVSVVDSFTKNSDLVSYVNIDTNEKTLNSQEHEQDPYEITNQTHGTVHLDKNLIWKIGDMQPNETRQLVYFVKLNDQKNLRNNLIQNEADVYEKTYKKGDATASFTPQINYNMKKTDSELKQIEKNADGSYTIHYRLNFALNKDSSNFPLQDFEFLDGLDYPKSDTDSTILKYVTYNRNSVHVYAKKDGQSTYAEVDKSQYSLAWAKGDTAYQTKWDNQDGNPTRFKITGTSDNPLIINPGDSYYVDYSVSVKPEAMAVLKSNSVTIKNRFLTYASNAKSLNGFSYLDAYSHNKTVDGYNWNQKIVDNKTDTEKTIEMNGKKYMIANDGVKEDTSSNGSFTVPAGSYPYTVKVNQTMGDWDATEVTMKDALSSENMEYVGYGKIEAYACGTTNKEYTLEGTKWLKIDGLHSFQIKPSDLGWKNKKYAYTFTYYAKPVNQDTYSEIKVNNTFSLDGKAVRDGQSFDISNIRSNQEVTISGNYSMNVKKSSWYYQEPEKDAQTWTKGKLYWAIEVSGTSIKKGTVFKDTILKDRATTVSYLHSNSLAGIYLGKLKDGKSIESFTNLEDLITNSGLQSVQDKFSSPSYSNGSNNQYQELRVQANENISLSDDNKLYIIVCSEPGSLPPNYRDTRTFKNKVSTSDDGQNFIDRDTAIKYLCGGGDILKELGQTFTYDGKNIKSNSDGKDNGSTSKIVAKSLDGPGLYASWNFKLNYAGDLSGTYRALENIPDGMKLAYMRIKWVGSKQGDIHSKTIQESGWTSKSITANMDNKTNKTTTYYVNGNQALIELGDFVAGKETDQYAVDVQVVCRVTDPDVLMGNETKTFTNKVTLQTEDGQDISTATCPATLKTNNITKTFTTNKSERVNFTIQSNLLGQQLPTNTGKLKLIDKLSSTLTLDTTSIKAVKTGTNESINNIKYSLGSDNTLEIELPNNIPITITYTALVNAPPGKNVSFSNVAYWENYSPSSGSKVNVDSYSYVAGGTVSSGDNIKLEINKKDQNNLSVSLPGAKFNVTECQRKEDGTFEEIGKSWSGTTGEDGKLVFGTGSGEDVAMKYNTVYKIVETQAPSGYIKEDTPIYIMVPKQDKDGNYSEYVQKCINDSQIQKQYQPIFKLDVTNHKGEIKVEKKFLNAGGMESKPISGTYKFGIYRNSQGNGSPIQTVQIVYNALDQSTKSATFKDLDINETYYVYELDDNDQPIKDSKIISTIHGMAFTTSYSKTNGLKNGDTLIVTNQSHTKKLPSTGGYGSFIYQFTGVVLIVISGILNVKKKQMERNI